MAFETPNKKFIPVFIMIVLVGMLMLFGLIWLWKHKQGWLAVITYFAYALIFLLIIGTIIGAIIWLFKTQRIDMIHIHKQRIINACKLCRPPFKQALMFRGSDEIEGRIIGEVVGVAMTKNIPIRLDPEQREFLVQKGAKEKDIKEAMKPQDLYWIAFKKGMFSTELFCGMKEDFTHLSGSIIYLNGMTFAPPLYDVFYLARRWHETRTIDETIAQTIRRYVLQEFLKEEKTIFDDVLAISPQHQKALEQTRMRTIQQDLSSGKQQQQQQGGGS